MCLNAREWRCAACICSMQLCGVLQPPWRALSCGPAGRTDTACICRVLGAGVHIVECMCIHVGGRMCMHLNLGMGCMIPCSPCNVHRHMRCMGHVSPALGLGLAPLNPTLVLSSPFARLTTGWADRRCWIWCEDLCHPGSSFQVCMKQRRKKRAVSLSMGQKAVYLCQVFMICSPSAL